jgi:TRAP-type transport system periplasmic protein
MTSSTKVRVGGIARLGMARFRISRVGVARFGVARFGMARLGLALLLLAAAPAWNVSGSGAVAQTVVKLATLVPDGSIWHQVLQEQATDWRRATGGSSEIRIYPGGVAGDDPDLVRKMRIGQFQAASLAIQGLSEIDEAFRVFQIPMFFASAEETFYILDAMTPLLRQRLEERGFVLVNWGYAGWAHLYSKRPIRSAADLRSRKLFMWGGDDRTIRVWREHGLQPLGLAATDIMMALQTGMIEVMVTTPLAALSLQWYRLTPNQLDPGLAPLIGATVMTQRGWNTLSERERQALLQTGRRAEARFRTEIPEHEKRAVAAMMSRGLSRNTIDRAAEAEWDTLTASIMSAHRGRLVPADMYDRALQLRTEYRRRVAGAGG